MSTQHDQETERDWERTVDQLFLCEVRVIRRLANARIRRLAGRVRPGQEACGCSYCEVSP